MNHIDGRTIIITGAASGFGRLLAEKTAAMGANVGACDIDGAALAGLAGDRIERAAVDVTDLAALGEFVERVAVRFGTIDVNQPWGVSISDVTVRASNDDYVI